MAITLDGCSIKTSEPSLPLLVLPVLHGMKGFPVTRKTPNVQDSGLASAATTLSQGMLGGLLGSLPSQLYKGLGFAITLPALQQLQNWIPYGEKSLRVKLWVQK